MYRMFSYLIHTQSQFFHCSHISLVLPSAFHSTVPSWSCPKSSKVTHRRVLNDAVGCSYLGVYPRTFERTRHRPLRRLLTYHILLIACFSGHVGCAKPGESLICRVNSPCFAGYPSQRAASYSLQHFTARKGPL
jgi:hypothetical protein